MAEREELSVDCRRAAQRLLDGGYFRASISRSYYAAYSAVTARLVQNQVAFPQGWSSPRHRDLPGYIQSTLTALPEYKRKQVKAYVRYLRIARVDADYVPSASLDRRAALEALRRASSVLRELEVES